MTKLEDGIIVSNGPCWSPDGKTFYFTDSWSGEISAYDYDLATGDISNKRTFAKMTEAGGGFDGATVDAEGGVWSAHVYVGKIARYLPDGTVERVIEMPVKKVTSCMFGGPDLDILYVTSMAKPPLPRFPSDGVQRGALFAIHGLGLTGLPEPRIRGLIGGLVPGECLTILRRGKAVRAPQHMAGWAQRWMRGKRRSHSYPWS